MWHPEVWPYAYRPSYVLRLGQAFIQLWQLNGLRWKLVNSQEAGHLVYNQHQAIADLLPSISQTLPNGARVQVLADSKWMPVSLLQTGKRPLSKDQVTALARHRFTQIFGEQASGWNTQTTYVAGDVQALAFACHPDLEAALHQGLQTERGKNHFAGLAPTLSWTWDRLWRSSTSRARKWLVLTEHDRSLWVLAFRGQVKELRPAGPVLVSAQQIAKVLQTEALRCGVMDETKEIHGASFEAMPTMTAEPLPNGYQWHAFEAIESPV